MFVTENTIQAEGLCNFLKRSASAGKEIAINVWNTCNSIGNRSKNGTAAVSLNPRAVLSSVSDVLNFYKTGHGLYLEETVKFQIKKKLIYRFIKSLPIS